MEFCSRCLLKSMAKKLKVTVCVTTYNESLSISNLLESLPKQTYPIDEIIIVDAGSKDGTTEKVKKFKKVKLIVRNGISRSAGRNLAISKAKNKIVAITDAGCIPDKDWLEEIIKPFSKDNSIDVVSGYFKPICSNSFEKAVSCFLISKRIHLGNSFQPSSRSVAFKKDIWKKVGGYPESVTGTAEDTVFNFNLVKENAKFIFNKRAVVGWKMPGNLFDFAKKAYYYAKGDAGSGIFWNPSKGIGTHNLKVISIFLRYVVLFLIFMENTALGLIMLTMYIFWAFTKAGVWGIPLQLTSDFSVMLGFLDGTFE